MGLIESKEKQQWAKTLAHFGIGRYAPFDRKRAVVSGSAVLHALFSKSTCFEQPDWTPNDIDIFCTTESKTNGCEEMQKYLEKSGFIEHHSNQIYPYRNTVKTFKRFANKPVQLIHVQSIDDAIKNFDMQIYQNWYDGKTFGCLHPEMVRHRITTIEVRDPLRIQKTTSRGITILNSREELSHYIH